MPEATMSWSAGRLVPVIPSVTGCSTCSRGGTRRCRRACSPPSEPAPPPHVPSCRASPAQPPAAGPLPRSSGSGAASSSRDQTAPQRCPSCPRAAGSRCAARPAAAGGCVWGSAQQGDAAGGGGGLVRAYKERARGRQARARKRSWPHSDGRWCGPARAAHRAQAHEEDGRALDLIHHRLVHGSNLLRLRGHPHALAPAALGGLDHDGVADALGDAHRLLRRVDARLGELVLGHVHPAVGVGLHSHACARPGDARHARRFGDDGRGNLVAQQEHGTVCRADEDHPILLQRPGQRRVLRRMAPTRPDGVDAVVKCKPHDHRDVGIVVEVGAARHLDEGVRMVQVHRVGLDVLRCRHGDDPDQRGVAEPLKQPVTDGHAKLGGGHAVVRHQDRTDAPVAARGAHELLILLLRRHPPPQRSAAPGMRAWRARPIRHHNRSPSLCRPAQKQKCRPADLE
eukprot:scaffold1116_cov103-Isochrysis_galbana.AAC.14